MKTIELTKGLSAIVDDEDFEYLNQFSWCHIRAGAQTRINGQRVLMHQLLLPVSDGFVPDHKNRNNLDNRRSNLRPATYAQNSQNKSPAHGRRYKGVGKTKHGKKRVFSAKITHDGKGIFLGLFTTEWMAAHAYDLKAVELFGEFAGLNFPQRHTINPYEYSYNVVREVCKAMGYADTVLLDPEYNQDDDLAPFLKFRNYLVYWSKDGSFSLYKQTDGENDDELIRSNYKDIWPLMQDLLLSEYEQQLAEVFQKVGDEIENDG